jgi:Outer membrane protein beta-barrel domain
MKKLIFTLGFIAALCNTTFAKKVKTDDIFDKYRFSLFAGFGVNSLKPVNATSDNYAISKTKNHTGFLFGISADWNLNERYTAFTGLGLDWRGGSIASAHDSTALKADYLRSTAVDYKWQYVTIPLGLKLKAAELDKLKIYAQTGVDLGIMVSQKGNYNGVLASGLGATPISNSKLKGFANGVPVNFGWSIGVGGEYKLNKSNSGYVTLLYRNGISDATAPNLNTAGNKFNDGNIRTNTFSLRVGYYF